MKQLALVLFLVQSLGLAAQQPKTELPFVAYWANGDTYLFDVYKVKHEYEGDSLRKFDSTYYRASFTVIDSTAEQYTISWKIIDGYTNRPLSHLEPGSPSDMFHMTGDITEVIYKTNEVGAFQELVNGAAIRQQLLALFKAATKQAAEEKKVPLDTLSRVMVPMVDVISSDEGIMSLLFKEISEFHSPMGGSFQPEDTLRFENEYPDLVNGGTMPADAVFFFTEVDTTEGYCAYRLTQKPGAAGFRKIMTGLMSKMGYDGNTSGMFDDIKVDIEDVTDARYFYYPCIPLRLDVQRKIAVTTPNSTRNTIERLQVSLVAESDGGE